MGKDAERLAFALSVSLFTASSLFFVSALPLRFFAPDLLHVLLAVSGLVISLVVLFWMAVKFDKLASGAAAAFYVAFVLCSTQSSYFASIVLQSFMFSFPFAWLLFVRRKKIGKIFAEFGISWKRWLFNSAAGIAVTLFVLYPLMLIEVIVMRLIGITDMGNVSDVLMKAPAWLLVASFTIAPIAEETFFRAFLIRGFAGFVKKTVRKIPERQAMAAGILFSTLLFMLAHYSYGSISEFVGALTIGLVFAIMYVLSGSLVMVVVAHALFNLISVLLMYYANNLLPAGLIP